MKALLILAVVSLTGGSALAGDLDIQVSGVRSARGQVLLAVCDRSTFLSSKRCAYSAAAPAAQGQVRLRVEGVPAGAWAVQVFHDANGDGRLDRNLIGMPKEGTAFSRDAPMKFGPPKFDDAAVTVGDAPQTLTVTMRY